MSPKVFAVRGDLRQYKNTCLPISNFFRNQSKTENFPLHRNVTFFPIDNSEGFSANVV